MCGILLHTGCRQAPKRDGNPCLPVWWAAAARGIDGRGPDAPGVQVSCTDDIRQNVYTIHASVMALRGTGVTAQPLESDDGTLLFLWNGEVFETSEAAFDFGAHDGQQLFASIQHELTRRIDHQSRESALRGAFSQVLGAIDGPFAAVLVDLRSGSVIYGRDTLGRRSLLVARHDEDVVLLSAACKEMNDVAVSEVPSESFWQLQNGNFNAIPRQDTIYSRRAVLKDMEDGGTFNADDVQAAFFKVLSDSVKIRVIGTRVHPQESPAHADVAVLFSGGIDCTAIAMLAHHHLPSEEPIDLLNVAFENPRTLQSKSNAPDVGGKENLSRDSNTHHDASAYDVPDRKTGHASLAELQRLAPQRKWRFIAIDVPFAEYTATRSDIEALLSPNASVMDLSIGAALYFASRGIGSVDASTNSYRSRARVLLSGLGADEQLGGYTRHRRAWERARVQTMPDEPPAAPGIPATNANMTKRQALVAELQLDLDRLPTRNLGRDDRVLSVSGREARYPFLARSVIDFLASLPVEAKMDLDKPPGVGDKALLRRVAANHLGLTQASGLTKRAIQFGARSAKMDVSHGRSKGQDSLRDGGT